MRFQNGRTARFGSSIFGEMSALATELKAVNLGQGFPNFDGPEEIKNKAIDALKSGFNQYCPSIGLPELRASISRHAKRFYAMDVNAQTEVLVTAGATEALFATAQALLSVGDEAIVFEPFYDSYEASILMAGAVPKYVLLNQPDAQHAAWWFDEKEIERAFTSKTRVVFVNTPHNPTGKIFTRSELLFLGQLCQKHGAILVCDEVYEHLTFDELKHVRAQSIDSIRESVLTISSAGKTFSYTGWKVGWIIGSADLISLVHRAHQWITFCTPPAFQLAMAFALDLPDSFYSSFQLEYQARRNRLATILTKAKLPVLACSGTYFLLANTDAHRKPGETDVDFCKRFAHEKGVVSIPPSVFYSREHKSLAQGLARFAFCKTDDVLDAAAARFNSFM
jgi:N-succinyldiaminopimelate aminotransferase